MGISLPFLGISSLLLSPRSSSLLLALPPLLLLLLALLLGKPLGLFLFGRPLGLLRRLAGFFCRQARSLFRRLLRPALFLVPALLLLPRLPLALLLLLTSYLLPHASCLLLPLLLH